jgi:hypothetical protein
MGMAEVLEALWVPRKRQFGAGLALSGREQRLARPVAGREHQATFSA